MKSDGGLRAMFRESLPGLDWNTLETGWVNPGVPDSNYCREGVEGWVEYKWTEGWTVDLRTEQVGWHVRRARHGGRCFVAVRRLCGAGPKRAAADELYLCSGAYAPELKRLGLRGAPGAAVLRHWPGGPGRWDWAELRRVLLDPLQPPRRVTGSLTHGKHERPPPG